MKNIFKTGDILFGKLRPYLRKYWFAKFDGVCSSEVWVFNSCNRRCLNDYLFYLIQSDLFIQISNVASGSKMPRADWDYISNLPFVLPPLPEQQKIAEILSVWDRAIDAQTQLIASLQTRKRALMQQLLTGKKRLKGFSGEWCKYPYEKLLKTIKRPIVWDDNELYNLISVRRRSGGIFFRDELYGHQIKVKDLRSVEEGDFLFSKMQIVHGASALVTKDYVGAKVSGSYISVVVKDGKLLNIDFLNYFSQQKYF